MTNRPCLATAAVGLTMCGGLVVANAASATVLMDAFTTGSEVVTLKKTVTVPG